MAKFSFKELVNPRDIISTKFNEDVNDNDVGKPVKLTAADVYGLCSSGDEIEGFIVGIETATADGKKFGSIQVGGRKRVELSGAIAIGGYVNAGAVAAANTAEANGLPLVIAASAPAAGDHFFWRVISGTGLDGDTTAIIERVLG